MYKRILMCLLLIGACLFMLTACGEKTPTQEPPAQDLPTQQPSTQEPVAEEPTEQKPVRIALFHTVLGNTYTKAVSDGVEEAAKRMGATVDVFGADPAYDAVSQSRQIQDAIVANKYDVFIIYACDGNAVVPDVEDAIAAGIKVVAIDVVIGPDARTYEPYDGIVSYIGRTGIDHGKYLGEMIVRACDTVETKPCKVGYLNGAQSLTIDQDRVEAITKVLADHSDIEIVSNQEAFYLQDKGYEVAQNMLQAHPDINVFATSGDQMMLGAEQAVKDAGLTGKILLLGNGTSQQGYDAIKEGRFWAAYADIPYTMGQIAGEIAIKAVLGEEVPRSVKNDDQRPPLPADGPIITKENVDQFLPQW
ncbi:MAG: sugar ABC transporter substrate-binding protein [Chloroflexi bacterium]|nr:sugar ABC transporter substrate-binding protein [Chloroflexota bacterium]